MPGKDLSRVFVERAAAGSALHIEILEAKRRAERARAEAALAEQVDRDADDARHANEVAERMLAIRQAAHGES